MNCCPQLKILGGLILLLSSVATFARSALQTLKPTQGQCDDICSMVTQFEATSFQAVLNLFLPAYLAHGRKAPRCLRY
jgi:hypothetical protein